MGESVELRVLLSDWDGDARCWKLPRAPGMMVTGVSNEAGFLPPADYALRTTRNHILVAWKLQTPPPGEPIAIVTFRADTRFRWFRDPRFFAPVLALVGVLVAAGLSFYGQEHGRNSQLLERGMASLAQQSKSLACNNALDGQAGVQACLQNYGKLKDDYAGALRKYQDEVNANQQLWDERNASAEETPAAKYHHRKNSVGVSTKGKPK